MSFRCDLQSLQGGTQPLIIFLYPGSIFAAMKTFPSDEIRAIGQGADEILSAIGRYHSVQCGTKRHREQLDEHHLVHMLSWTREVQAKSVALCELLLQLEPFTLPHRK